MKNKIISILTFLVCFASFAQKEVTWEDLADVTFERRFNRDFEEHFLYPTFSQAIKDLDGKKISITGYFLDMDPKGEIYVLSKGPMSSCFFCGAGGPETAMEIYFKSRPTAFKMDDIITVTGILKVNSEDVNHFNYILTECTAKITAKDMFKNSPLKKELLNMSN